jgi:chromosome partitioning protein
MINMQSNVSRIGGAPAGYDATRDGEHPDVVLRDVLSRQKPRGHIIVFANEKGGVGKSTMAFHTAIALCDAGHKVAVIDLDARQQTLGRALGNREAISRRLKLTLPSPSHVTLTQQSGAYLNQEIARIGWECSHVLIDVAGADSALARRAIAIADTLVTPINNSFADLDLLGHFDAVTMKLRGLGHFAAMAVGLAEARRRHGMVQADWIVMQNRVRRSGSNNEARFEIALQQLAHKAGFRLGTGFGERVAYRELFLFGLTHLDLKHIPELAKTKLTAKHEIERLIENLRLPSTAENEPDLFGSDALLAISA